LATFSNAQLRSGTIKILLLFLFVSFKLILSDGFCIFINKAKFMDNNKKYQVDLNRLSAKVYNAVALWHNEDGTPQQKQDSLKIISDEIIEMVINDVLQPLSVQTKIEEASSKGASAEKKENFINKFFKNKQK
jgi:hypothetical protein